MGFPAPPFGASPQGPPTTTTVRYPAPAYPPWAMAPPRMPDGVSNVNTGGAIAIIGGVIVGIGWLLPMAGWEVVVGIGWLMFGSGVGLALMGIGKALASR